jgi:hypothetical protein
MRRPIMRMAPSSAVNSMALLSKTGAGQFDVLILQNDTDLCNEEIIVDQPVGKPMEMSRVWHRYGKTHGVPKTGIAGTGMLDFATPRHTAYPNRGVTGTGRPGMLTKQSKFLFYFSILTTSQT